MAAEWPNLESRAELPHPLIINRAIAPVTGRPACQLAGRKWRRRDFAAAIGCPAVAWPAWPWQSGANNAEPTGGNHEGNNAAASAGSGRRCPTAAGRGRPRAAADHRQRREGVVRRDCGQDHHSSGRQGHGVDHRHRRPGEAAHRRQSAADELDHRPAGQPGDHPRSAPGAGRQFARLGQGRRRLEGGARQQDLRHRPDRVAARTDRHGRSRQTGFRHGDQPRRNIGIGRQPR
jgi:hypothetical protein